LQSISNRSTSKPVNHEGLCQPATSLYRHDTTRQGRHQGRESRV
jgi:hypothetical protein